MTLDEIQNWLFHDGLRVLVTLVLAALLRWLLHRLINRVVATMTSKATARLAEATRAGRVLADATGLANERHTQRMETMGSLLRSIVTFVVYTIAALTIMSLVGIPLGPLLASAGVGGVALGFGAQSLVKDFLSGIFMIIEDQYGVGDYIDTGLAVGTVEEVSLRVTRLRDANGMTWYVRNGEVLRIGNKSQGWALAIVDVPVSYEESAEKVIGIIRTVSNALAVDPQWAPWLEATPEVQGVESIIGGTMTIRVHAKAAPDHNVAVARELRERIKIACDEAGILPPGLLPPGFLTGTPPTGGPR